MNNLRDLRVERGLTIREVADRMGVHFTSVARIERSERALNSSWTQRFAEALHVDPSQIVNGAVPTGRPGPSMRTLPIIGEVAAGNWREAVQHPDGVLPSPFGGENAFVLSIKGDSMDRITPANSLVIVDPDQPELHDGVLYVIMNSEGETTYKQYRANPARLEPVSTNEDHKPIQLGRSPFEVVGRVVGYFAPL